MKRFLKVLSWCWGPIPLLFFLLCSAGLGIYKSQNDVILRSVPFQLLYWGFIFSIIVILIWVFVLVFRVMPKKESKITHGSWAIACGVVSMSVLLLSPIAIFFSVMQYEPEHVMELHGMKMVGRVSSFLDVNVSYYEYQNFFFCGSKELGREWYGSGGYDPLEDGYHPEYRRSWEFYDLDGNLIERGDSSGTYNGG